MQVPEGRCLQAEGTTGAKALGQGQQEGSMAGAK